MLVRVLPARDDGPGRTRDEGTQAHAEQVIRKLREGERLLGQGKEVGEVCRHLEISEATYHRWQRQYGGMKGDDVKRLKELERENAALKRIVADKELENVALREVAKGNW